MLAALVVLRRTLGHRAHARSETWRCVNKPWRDWQNCMGNPARKPRGRDREGSGASSSEKSAQPCGFHKPPLSLQVTEALRVPHWARSETEDIAQ